MELLKSYVDAFVLPKVRGRKATKRRRVQRGMAGHLRFLATQEPKAVEEKKPLILPLS